MDWNRASTRGDDVHRGPSCAKLAPQPRRFWRSHVTPRKTTLYALLVAGLAAFAATRAAAEIKDRIAAVVNGQPITLSDVIERVQMELARIATDLPPKEREQQRKDLIRRGLEQLIDETVVEAEANQMGVEVTEEEVQRQLEALAKQNGMDVDRLRIAVTEVGITIDTIRESLRRQALRERLMQYRVKPRKVTDEEVQSAYAMQASENEVEMRVRGIFVPTPDPADTSKEEASRAKAELAVQRLAKGEEFAVVARDLSSGPSAREGGDLGWVRKGVLFAEADAAIARLKPRQMSPLLRTSSGWHIFFLEAKRQQTSKPLSEVREEIRNRILSESIVRERENYVKALRKRAQVEVLLQ